MHKKKVKSNKGTSKLKLKLKLNKLLLKLELKLNKLLLRETIDSLLVDYELVVEEAVSNGIDVLTQVDFCATRASLLGHPG